LVLSINVQADAREQVDQAHREAEAAQIGQVRTEAASNATQSAADTAAAELAGVRAELRELTRLIRTTEPLRRAA
jgi:hypothetical protein